MLVYLACIQRKPQCIRIVSVTLTFRSFVNYRHVGEGPVLPEVSLGTPVSVITFPVLMR